MYNNVIFLKIDFHIKLLYNNIIKINKYILCGYDGVGTKVLVPAHISAQFCGFYPTQYGYFWWIPTGYGSNYHPY
jgi:hypothetical protein